MQKVVSITSQGQLTIPQEIIRLLGISIPTKALISENNGVIEVKTKGDFWSLSGSLKSDIKLTDEQLKKARQSFGRSWAKQ